MATSQMSEVIQHLRRTVLLRDGTGMTDGQLLNRFVEARDQDAFAALVKRHGPMVWGVCGRLLPNHQDAEDAFQATFLVLVRKAATVLPRELVANWLYGVASMTAHRSKVAAAKRRRREKQLVELPEPAVTEQDLWTDLRPLLDQELSRLPDKYRVVIVLCDLEGKTRPEVARQLGCPEGTVASRLARARALLAKRLARHGLAVTGGTLGAVLSQRAASACVPTAVMNSTIEAVTLVAAGKAATAGVLSVKVVALTEGVLKTMLLTKLKTAMAALFAVLGIVAFGGGLYLHQAVAQQGPGEKPPAVAEKSETEKGGDPIPSSDDLRGNWKGEKNGIKVELTFTGEKAHWQVDFVKTRKPKEAFESPNVGVGIGADLKCVPDVKAGRLNLYLPAYLGNDKELNKKYPVLTGRAPVGEITRGADRTIQLRIIPSGYENLDQEEYDYPAVEGLILRRIAMNDLEGAQQSPGEKSEKEGEALAEGKAVGGLRIHLQPPAPEKGKLLPSHCVVILENVSDTDMNVQLGYSLANGKSHHPAALRLCAFSKGNKTRTLTYSEVRVGGRVDPLVVPLLAGSTYTLRCQLDKFADSETGEAIDLTAKDYRIVAELVGQPVTKVNPDLQGFALMSFWQGTVRSNEVPFSLAKKTVSDGTLYVAPPTNK